MRRLPAFEAFFTQSRTQRTWQTTQHSWRMKILNATPTTLNNTSCLIHWRRRWRFCLPSRRRTRWRRRTHSLSRWFSTPCPGAEVDGRQVVAQLVWVVAEYVIFNFTIIVNDVPIPKNIFKIGTPAPHGVIAQQSARGTTTR